MGDIDGSVHDGPNGLLRFGVTVATKGLHRGLGVSHLRLRPAQQTQGSEAMHRIEAVREITEGLDDLDRAVAHIKIALGAIRESLGELELQPAPEPTRLPARGSEPPPALEDQEAASAGGFPGSRAAGSPTLLSLAQASSPALLVGLALC